MLCDYAVKLTLTPGAVNETDVAALRHTGFTDQQITIAAQVIGYFNYRRMLMLRNFTTEGLSSNGKSVPETAKGKRDTANFFLLHYGFFHLGQFAADYKRTFHEAPSNTLRRN